MSTHPKDNNWSDFISNRNRWSLATFGSGTRVRGIIKHIRKELQEIEENPADPLEWVDVIMLALDGMARQGHGSPHQVLYYLRKKLEIVQQREWPVPDPEGENPVEHIRDAEHYGASPLEKAIGPMSRKKFADFDLLKKAFDQNTHTKVNHEHFLADCSRCGSKRARPILQKFPSLLSFEEMWVVYCNDMECLPKGKPSNPEQPISGATEGEAVENWNAEHRADGE